VPVLTVVAAVLSTLPLALADVRHFGPGLRQSQAESAPQPKTVSTNDALLMSIGRDPGT